MRGGMSGLGAIFSATSFDPEPVVVVDVIQAGATETDHWQFAGALMFRVRFCPDDGVAGSTEFTITTLVLQPLPPCVTVRFWSPIVIKPVLVEADGLLATL
jgi:hypothetical protein